MDNHIDPTMRAILIQLDRMKDSVATAADDNLRMYADINALRKENEQLVRKNRQLLDDAVRGNKVIESSTVSMIISWILAAAVCVYTTLAA